MPLVRIGEEAGSCDMSHAFLSDVVGLKWASGVDFWLRLLVKRFLSIHLLHFRRLRTCVLEVEKRERTVPRYTCFLRWRNVEMFAVPPSSQGKYNRRLSNY